MQRRLPLETLYSKPHGAARPRRVSRRAKAAEAWRCHLTPVSRFWFVDPEAPGLQPPSHGSGAADAAPECAPPARRNRTSPLLLRIGSAHPTVPMLLPDGTTVPRSSGSSTACEVGELAIS